MSNVFISYRRDDAAGHAGRLYDDLRERLGKDSRVFLDVADLQPGVTWDQAIDHALAGSAVLLAVIGRRWLEVADEDGRRLGDPRDRLRRELSFALGRGINVIPVLVQGAKLPDSGELPADLKPLVSRQSIELSDSRWNHDVGRLAVVLGGQAVPPPTTVGLHPMQVAVAFVGFLVFFFVVAAFMYPFGRWFGWFSALAAGAAFLWLHRTHARPYLRGALAGAVIGAILAALFVQY
jgi:TIR domain